MVRYLIVLFLILLTNFSFSQRTVTLIQTHTDAEIGLDRKAFDGLGITGRLSEGYANDFTLPVKINPCEKITNVKVEINITNYSNPSACPIFTTYFNLFYGCTPYAGGATCLPANLIAEPDYPPTTSGATLNFNTSDPRYNKLDFGGNLSVDIMPVSNPGCRAVSSGGLTYKYTTTVTVTIEDIPLTLEILDPAPVCSGTPVNITLPAILKPGSTTGTTLTYWTDSGATIGLPNPSAITTSDTYYIKSTLGSCSIIKPVVVTIAPPIVLPVVTTPINLCVSAPTALIANPSVGHTLKWYGANATGGTASSIATIPSATGTYYVSQTNGVCESDRVAIQANLVADTGATFQNFRCDSSQILPSDKNSSVYFDWSNNPLTPNDVYSYSYTIQGGSAFTSTTINSSLQVFGMLPGQSATLTLSSAKYPCKPTVTETCIVPCGTSTVTPTFAAIPTSYCLNDIPPTLPTTSTNTTPITGSWSPFPVDTSTKGTKTYTFTPDSILFPCAKTTTLNISVKPIEPDFIDFSICFGDTAPSLSNISPNGITGAWNPSTVDNLNSSSYVFTPDSGQPCTPSNKTINITVNPSNVILSLNWTVTEAFSKNQIVTVTNPVGSNYLYQVDFGPFQTSPVFENVASGLHSISVKHVNGCSEFTENNVLIIGYPKFFTPNGDGYNDTWNIPGLKDQLNSRIHIFDRYGKLLKDISPNDPGWDGTYIGQPMPADDYWFNVEYIENAVLKKFKSHFSLKR